MFINILLIKKTLTVTNLLITYLSTAPAFGGEVTHFRVHSRPAAHNFYPPRLPRILNPNLVMHFTFWIFESPVLFTILSTKGHKLLSILVNYFTYFIHSVLFHDETRGIYSCHITAKRKNQAKTETSLIRN